MKKVDFHLLDVSIGKLSLGGKTNPELRVSLV